MISLQAQAIAAAAFLMWSPPADLTVTQWAEENRRLSVESAAEPAKYRGDRAPYQIGMQDVVDDDGVDKVVYMTSAQVGKTTAIENILGKIVDLDPCPILALLPTVEKAEEFSKERLAPMIRDTPALAKRFKTAKSRDSSNTIRVKNFEGGTIAMVGANAPAGLASRPRRVLLADEIDRMKRSAGTEGDPLALARRRLANYFNSIEVLTSTPGDKDSSAIYREFMKSDQRYFFVPCTCCGEYFNMEFKHLLWKSEDGIVIPESVHYECQNCSGSIYRSDQAAMLAAGKWVATKPFRGVAGFHLWTIYSPWTEWFEIAQECVSAGKDPDLLKVYNNTYLGIPWAEKGETVNYKGLYRRRENYGAEVPDGVVMLTAGGDTQNDRLEITVYGWGPGEEAYGIAHFVLWGDPNDVGTPEEPNVWARLDEVLFGPGFKKASGRQMPISSTCIDAGGHRMTSVIKYCKPRFGKRVYPIIGKHGQNREIIGQPSTKKTGKQKKTAKVWTVGVDEAKGTIYSRMKLDEHGPGYVHFPRTHDFGEDFFKQLTAETKITETKNGVEVIRWKIRHGRRRNEALDCFVYAFAALRQLNPNWASWIAKEAQYLAESEGAPEAKPSALVRRKKLVRRKSFATNWRES